MHTRWGVLGSGGIAARRTIPEGLMQSQSADLVAVFDVNQARNREIAEKYGAVACTTEEELLHSACDVVYVASPVSEHCRQVTRAAELGKHVFCEKPLGLSVEEAECMVAACRKHNVKFGVGFMMRFQSQHQHALELIQQGRLGKLVYGRAQVSCWYPPIEGAWRQDPATGGGGSLIDMGCHCIDLLEMFFGKVKTVFCRLGNRIQPYRSEDSAIVVLEFNDGSQGIVEAFFNVPDEASRNRLEIYGSRGSILAEGTIGQAPSGAMQACIKNDDQAYDPQQERTKVEFFAIEPTPVNTYYAEIEAFSQAVLFDADPPVSGMTGLWNQKIVQACYESARTGTVMPVV